MNNFQLLELSGRTAFSHKLIKNGSSAITYTDHFCPVDILWSKNGKDYAGEIKCRMKYASSDLDSALIEEHKYNDVIQYAKENERIPYYIMMFNDNIGYMWKLDDQDITWITRDLPKTTYGSVDKISHSCGFLLFENGQKFKIRS